MKYIFALLAFSMFSFAPRLVAQNLDTVRVKGYILKETYIRKETKDRKRYKDLKSVSYPIDVIYTYRFLPCKDDDCRFDNALEFSDKGKIESIFTFCPILRPHFFFKNVLGREAPTEFQCPISKLESTCEYRTKHRVAQVFYIDGLWITAKYNSNMNVIKPPFDTRYTNFKGTVDLFYLVGVSQFIDWCVSDDKN